MFWLSIFYWFNEWTGVTIRAIGNHTEYVHQANWHPELLLLHVPITPDSSSTDLVQNFLRPSAALGGVPGLNSMELLQVQASYMMLVWAVTCLTLIYQENIGADKEPATPPALAEAFADLATPLVNHNSLDFT